MSEIDNKIMDAKLDALSLYGKLIESYASLIACGNTETLNELILQCTEADAKIQLLIAQRDCRHENAENYGHGENEYIYCPDCGLRG